MEPAKSDRNDNCPFQKLDVALGRFLRDLVLLLLFFLFDLLLFLLDQFFLILLTASLSHYLPPF